MNELILKLVLWLILSKNLMNTGKDDLLNYRCSYFQDFSRKPNRKSKDRQLGG